jgi:hypothetical protein
VFAYEWLLRMIHGLAAWLVAHPLPLDEVSFPYPPPLHVADYELVFAPRHTFDAPRLEARFPAEWLALPVRRDEAALTPVPRRCAGQHHHALPPRPRAGPARARTPARRPARTPGAAGAWRAACSFRRAPCTAAWKTKAPVFAPSRTACAANSPPNG